MENLIFIIFCGLSLININIKGFNDFFYDYMEINNTSSIRGVFVWMIILSHNRSYYSKNIKYFYFSILNHFGQKMVSMFLFYSGYGINESIKKKGPNYIKSLPIKGIILFIKFQIILLIFLINSLLIGVKIELKQYLLSIIFKSSIGNSNWFSFTIICLYFYLYLSFGFFHINKFILVRIIVINILLYIHSYLTYYYFYPRQVYTINNILCFIFGIYYSFLKNYFDKIIMKNDILYLLYFSFLILIYNYFYNKKYNIFFNLLQNALFSLVIVMISIKIRFGNEFLKLLNSHSYSIYLLQRVVMIYVYRKRYFQYNEIIRFYFIFINILLLSSIFDRYTIFVDKFFKIKKVKINKSKMEKFSEEKVKLVYNFKL